MQLISFDFTGLLFLGLVPLALVLYYFGAGRDKRFILLFAAWQVLIGFLSATELFVAHPLLFPVAIVSTIILLIVLLRKKRRQLPGHHPVKTDTRFLLALHVLRIPVEIVLYLLYLQEMVPKIMTFEGWNMDIIAGITALAWLVYMLISGKQPPRQLFKAWNIFGLTTLAIIVSIALLSAPLPVQQFAFDQPNIAVLTFPYSLLPTCIVPLVFLSHLILLRASRTLES